MRTNRRRSERARGRQQVHFRYRLFAKGILAMAAGVVVALVLASDARAASVLDFDIWMQRMQKRVLSIQKNLKAENAAASAADARELEDLYRLTQLYFEQVGGPEEAVQLSKKGKQDSAAIAVGANTKDFGKAAEVVQTLMRDCRGCHREYKPFN